MSKSPIAKDLTVKIGEKGGLSVYGLGRFPVTLYASQWAVLLDPKVTRDIANFITDHWNELSHKGD